MFSGCTSIGCIPPKVKDSTTINSWKLPGEIYKVNNVCSRHTRYRICSFSATQKPVQRSWSSIRSLVVQNACRRRPRRRHREVPPHSWSLHHAAQLSLCGRGNACSDEKTRLAGDGLVHLCCENADTFGAHSPAIAFARLGKFKGGPECALTRVGQLSLRPLWGSSRDDASRSGCLLRSPEVFAAKRSTRPMAEVCGSEF